MKPSNASDRRRAAAQVGMFVPLFATLAIWTMDTPIPLALLVAAGGAAGVIIAGTISRMRSRQNG
jgi:hypothetical protein